MARYKIDHTGTICYICNSKDTYIRPNGDPEWIKYKDENGIWNEKSYMCKSCYGKLYQKDPKSSNSAKKSVANCRTGQLSIYSETGKGLINESVVAKVRNLRNMNIDEDNFRSKFDLSIDPEFGRPQIKGSTLIGKQFHVSIGEGRNFDHIWILCKDRNYIKKVYIIPVSELCNTYINIYDDWSKKERESSNFEWVEKYKVDEKPYNDAYKSLIEYLKNKKYFGIKDIKKWLSDNNG